MIVTQQKFYVIRLETTILASTSHILVFISGLFCVARVVLAKLFHIVRLLSAVESEQTKEHSMFFLVSKRLDRKISDGAIPLGSWF